MTTELKVHLADRTYPIYIGAACLTEAGVHARRAGVGRAGLLVTDACVNPLYGDSCLQAFEEAGFRMARCVVPSGEPSKSHDELLKIYDAALDAGLERSSFMVALGGGVIGDLAGYAAATYLRGVRLIQIPTTLLAMVDSSVGGKTGVNLPKGKNLIGAFHQPSLVVMDSDTLKSLPPREIRAGLAEVVKYGVISDPALLDTLEGLTVEQLMADDSGVLEHLLKRSCEIKADVVRQDEREGGLRAILNFGHTIGHAIEQATAYTRYLHGEAVSLGMVYALRLSERVSGLESAHSDRVIALLERIGLPVHLPDLSWDAIIKAMGRDKKKADGVVRFVLAKQLGTVQFGVAVEESLLKEVWHGCSQ